jgi:hypothetical protein
MSNHVIYEERLSSGLTEALFISLSALFLLLSILRIRSGRGGFLSLLAIFLFAFFLFYALNYRTLVIRIDSKSLELQFGLFHWSVPFENVESASLDVLPAFQRFAGAGIHFYFYHRRYRASFNFLEYPRVAVVFMRKVGPVQELSFSTRQPQEILRLLQKLLLVEC